ncbi:MAG: hypothetical protein QMD09_13615, partial [Desulfatibacillaceae bacterium]|nr:hypothetical protein [Desulfatibacillaceae bacterium]
MQTQDGKKGAAAHENLLGLLARGLLRHSAPEGIMSFALDFFLSTNLPFLNSTCSIFLFDSQQNELVLAAHRGSPERVRRCHKNLAPGQCLCGRAALEKKLIFEPQAHL